MTTKLDDIIQALHTHTARPQHLQYLRSLHASHEALLKAAKNAKTVLSDYDALPGERDRAIDGMARSIRAAEELSK